MRSIFAAIALLISAAPFCHAVPQTPADAIIIPTEICRDYFLVPITLAPRANSPANRTLWFLYDTGATEAYIDPSSVKRASGVNVKTGENAAIRNATIGPVKINKMQAKVRSLDHISRALGREIDGILPYGTFRDFLLTLDYQHGEMRLTKGELPQPDDQSVFVTKGPDKRPWLSIEFPNRKRRMLIDSGAATSGLVVKKLKRYPTTAAPVVIGAAFRLKKIEMRSGARLMGNARIGPFELVRPTLESTPGTELIGGEVLNRFNWTFDQKNKRVQIVQFDPETAITFEPIITHGMVLEIHKKGFRIKAIVPQTPAENADLKKGDVVTHWNGEPVGERGCREEDKEFLHLKLLRGTEEHEVEVALFSLVD